MLLSRSQGRNITLSTFLFFTNEVNSDTFVSPKRYFTCGLFKISICSPANFQLLTASTRPTASPMANSGGTLNFFGISLAWPDRFFPFLFVVAEKRVWSGLHTHLVLTPLEVLNKLRHQHFSRFENMKYGKPVLLSKQFSELPCVSGGFWCDMLCSRLKFDARR